MNDSLHIVCPHCMATNRVLSERLADKPTCGQCHRARFAIRSIPTLALFQGGREVARQAGAMGAADIARWARASG
jgi:hypothetical protein